MAIKWLNVRVCGFDFLTGNLGVFGVFTLKVGGDLF